MPDIMKNETNITDETIPDVQVPDIGTFMCIMILLLIRKKLRKN